MGRQGCCRAGRYVDSMPPVERYFDRRGTPPLGVQHGLGVCWVVWSALVAARRALLHSGPHKQRGTQSL